MMTADVEMSIPWTIYYRMGTPFFGGGGVGKERKTGVGCSPGEKFLGVSSDDEGTWQLVFGWDIIENPVRASCIISE